MFEKNEKRSANFSPIEIEILLQGLQNMPDLVSGTLGKMFKACEELKNGCEEIASMVNSVSLGVSRNGSQIKNKWQVLKSKTRKKAAELKNDLFKTSGGPTSSKKLTPVEEKVLSLIGLTCVEGILPLNIGDVTAQQALNSEMVPTELVGINETNCDAASRGKRKKTSVNRVRKCRDKKIREEIEENDAAVAVIVENQNFIKLNLENISTKMDKLQVTLDQINSNLSGLNHNVTSILTIMANHLNIPEEFNS